MVHIGSLLKYKLKNCQKGSNMFSAIKNVFLDKSFLIFLLVGIINTLFGLFITFTCYNIFHFDYWTSSALDYILASILSYILNKKYTFGYKETDLKSISRFALNIAVCYLIAFSVARPCTRCVLMQLGLNMSVTFIENIAMLTGTGLFMVINYIGQRFFAFKK